MGKELKDKISLSQYGIQDKTILTAHCFWNYYYYYYFLKYVKSSLRKPQLRWCSWNMEEIRLGLHINFNKIGYSYLII